MALDPNRQEFLETGARSYLQATAAIAMFQRHDQNFAQQDSRRDPAWYRPLLELNFACISMAMRDSAWRYAEE